MGANCAKVLGDNDPRTSSSRSHPNHRSSYDLYYSKSSSSHAEPETRNAAARFLAPETRRAGSYPVPFPEGTHQTVYLGLGDVTETSQAELVYDEGSGTILWNCGEVVQLIAGMQRGDRMRSGSLVCSPQFTIPSAGADLKWRLVWSVCDMNEDSASLYLQCCSAQQSKTPNSGPLHTRFTIGITNPNALDWVTARRSGIDMNLAHCFNREYGCWGIQELVSADEAADYLHHDTQTIQAFLRLVLVSAIPPSVRSDALAQSSQVSVELISEEPRILLFEDFLTRADCEALINLAKPDLQRSRVATGTETPSRTSFGTFLTGRKETESAVLCVEDKIADVLKEASVLRDGPKLRKALVKSEALQVVRYKKGEFYNEHYDNKAGNASHRAATFMIYLSDVESGGATYFPRSSGRPAATDAPIHSSRGAAHGHAHGHGGAKGSFWNAGAQRSSPPGLRIYPKQGRAIMFWSRLPNGSEDMSSIHAAEAVGSGEKWILTRWMRENE